MDGGSIDPLIAKGAGGILGGAVALSLDPPKTRRDFVRRMFVSAVCGIVLPGPVLRYLNIPLIDPVTKLPDYEWILAAGFAWGVMGYFVLSLIVRFFTNRRDKDLLEAARDIKDATFGDRK